MKLDEKIKFFRKSRGWTQENLAEKLGISTCAYAKIEPGKTDVNFSRLEQIAEVMEIDLPQLLGLDEKTVFNLTGSSHNTQGDNWYVNTPSTEQTECKHKLEKAELIIKQQQTEIVYLKQQINDLREIIHILKKSEKQS